MFLVVLYTTLQGIEDGKWHVDSLSGSSPDGYIITQQITACQQCTLQNDKVCTATECDSYVFTCTSVMTNATISIMATSVNIFIVFTLFHI